MMPLRVIPLTLEKAPEMYSAVPSGAASMPVTIPLIDKSRGEMSPVWLSKATKFSRE